MDNDLIKSIKNLFPIKWEKDYIEDLRKKLDSYLNIIKEKTKNSDVIDFIKDINEEIIKAISIYYNGLHY